jgi:hypothetical protein
MTEALIFINGSTIFTMFLYHGSIHVDQWKHHFFNMHSLATANMFLYNGSIHVDQWKHHFFQYAFLSESKHVFVPRKYSCRSMEAPFFQLHL